MTLPAPVAPEFFQEKFQRLERLFAKLKLGICVLDTELHFRQLNEVMAAMDGLPAQRHLGRTLADVDPKIWLVLEPLVRRVIAERFACIEPEVNVRPGAQDAPVKTWQVVCYPLRDRERNVLGVSLVVQDMTEVKAKEESQVERLRFEALLASLSATFINIPVSEVDQKIEQGLRKIVEFLGFDRSTVWRIDQRTREMVCTHSYSLPGIKLPPRILPPDLVPVWNDMVQRDEIFKISDIDEMPNAFWREKEYCKLQGGIRSIMFFPASVAGAVVGFITFVSYSVKRAWPDELIQRLRVVWDIFSNALERKRADEKIQEAMAEIEMLRDRLQAENHFLRDQINLENHHEEIVGQSEGIKKVLLQVEQVAGTDATVLIQGETGTGKELIARALHQLSPRKDRAMIKLNCAALPATLIESELFGHEKGAYTGAQSRQMGRFEAADGSTLFLDEVGELPLELQAKLLRVIQEGQFERLGSTRPIDVNVRVIAATNRDLSQAVAQRRFREDLFYRLNVFPIEVPPLRERPEDIPLLVWAVVAEFGKAFGKSIDRIPRKNMEELSRYRWPGNVRELRNMVERAMILATGPTLTIDVPELLPSGPAPALSMEEMERRHIVSVLENTGWRVRGKNGAADVLGLKPTTLDSRIKKLGIRRKPSGSEMS